MWPGETGYQTNMPAVWYLSETGGMLNPVHKIHAKSLFKYTDMHIKIINAAHGWAICCHLTLTLVVLKLKTHAIKLSSWKSTCMFSTLLFVLNLSKIVDIWLGKEWMCPDKYGPTVCMVE